MRHKLIEAKSSVTLPSGVVITTLHLTAEARAGLSTNGAEIPDALVPLPRVRVVQRRWWSRRWWGSR